MRLHYLQHVPFEGLGYIETWAFENNVGITSTKLFEGELLPSQNDFDFLVIMGGPMSVNDEHIYNWLKTENEFVLDTIKSNKPVIGICLGAQIIAKALGAKVYPNKQKEIGWFPVKKASKATDSVISRLFPREIKVFQWHGETFDLPAGAVHIAENSVCINQAFIYKEKVLGLQFHLEAISENINSLVMNCKDELVEAPYIQSAEIILSKTDTVESNNIMKDILEFLTNNLRTE